ncbi:single-stranded DNA-binding protein [Candidatus Bipolaricaulota bacterium]|jgi:single-strand DNA-binding protein|nr:single-stranded DNA-binding protein [Candidatus Bipolaricaulota bacterium]
MAASLNCVILIGNLTADPELRYTPSGTARTKFNIAVNRQYKNATGQLQEETTFVPIVTWGSQAENCANYLSKGRSVAIEGRLRIDSFENAEGERKKVVEVVASTVQFLGGAPRSGEASAQTAVPPSSSQPEASTTEEVPF